MISKTWRDREGWKNRDSLAWGSLKGKEGHMQYANLPIYRELLQEACFSVSLAGRTRNKQLWLHYVGFYFLSSLNFIFLWLWMIMYAMILYSCLQLFLCHFWMIIDELSTSVELDDFNFGCWTSLTRYFMYWSKSVARGRAALCIIELFLQIDWEIWFISVHLFLNGQTGWSLIISAGICLVFPKDFL